MYGALQAVLPQAVPEVPAGRQVPEAVLREAAQEPVSAAVQAL